VKSIFNSIGGGAAQIESGEIQRTTINEIPAALATTEVQSAKGGMRLTVYAYEFAPKTAYHIVAITEADGADPFGPLFTSVRRLSVAEAESVRPRAIKIITASAGDTMQSLSEGMAYSNYRLERSMA
jgi:predicted Zn-dependent protease